MPRILIILAIVISATSILSCSESKSKENTSTSEAKLQVLYFHSTYRCVTCNAVENESKKLLEESFKNEIKTGTIKFASINVDEEQNKAIAEKYEITFSTLLLIKLDCTKTDFTSTGFQYAKSNPAKYKELLKAEIIKQLAN
jgi:hypothetical protein